MVCRDWTYTKNCRLRFKAEEVQRYAQSTKAHKIKMKRLYKYARRRAARLRQKLWNLRFWPRLRRNPVAALKHLLFDVELDNFTYPIANAEEMAQFLSAATGVPKAELMGYVNELESNVALHEELQSAQKRPAHFGRRLGWYALIRALKPAVVVEAGVHDGLGATAILAALEKNGSGQMIGMDIDPKAGWLVPDYLRGRLEMIVGDIAQTLPPLCATRSVDFFIHDSDHSFEFEQMEYEVMLPHLPANALVLSDNALPASEESPCPLEKMAARMGRSYGYWKEVSIGHFYPGAGIGLTYSPAKGDAASTTASEDSRARSQTLNAPSLPVQ